MTVSYLPQFFISYTHADATWAEWIAGVLEEADYTVRLQAWDFLPGQNFVLAMDQAAAQAERTIAVLSPDYLTAHFTQPEWAAAFARDPTGVQRRLIPIRVRPCNLLGLLPQVIYIDLVDADEATARSRLLAGVSDTPRHPRAMPRFPGTRVP